MVAPVLGYAVVLIFASTTMGVFFCLGGKRKEALNA
jgi:hypothetical protein